MDTFLTILLLLTGLFLMLIVLLQRGRGGGLAGAFGGAGGQSMLGVKAGDTFTKITVVVAVIWVVLAGLSGIVLRSSNEDSPLVSEPTGERGSSVKSDPGSASSQKDEVAVPKKEKDGDNASVDNTDGKQPDGKQPDGKSPDDKQPDDKSPEGKSPEGKRDGK